MNFNKVLILNYFTQLHTIFKYKFLFYNILKIREINKSYLYGVL